MNLSPTEDVDVAKVFRDAVSQRGNLGLVGNIERNRNEGAAVLDACLLMGIYTELDHPVQRIRTTGGENNI